MTSLTRVAGVLLWQFEAIRDEEVRIWKMMQRGALANFAATLTLHHQFHLHRLQYAQPWIL